MRKFVWASPHNPTPQQLEELNTEGEVSYLKEINSELFDRICDCPSHPQELKRLRADLTSQIYALVNPLKEGIPTLVQPGGSPAFQFLLGKSRASLILPVWYGHSKRVSEDRPQPDGTIQKFSVYKHEGWTKL